MKIAIPYDFEDVTNIKREGIGIYLNYLVRSLLNIDHNLKIEIYTYDFNINNVETLFDNLSINSKARLSIVSNSYWTISDIVLYPFLFPKNIIEIFFLVVSLLYYLCLVNIFKFYKYNDKVVKRIKKIKIKCNTLLLKDYLKNQKIDIKRKKLIKIAKKSNANAVFCFFVSIKLGHYFKSKKIVQVHDLFTMAMPKLFKIQILNLEEINNIYRNNLALYAKENTIFVSSSRYIINEHCLKFIQNIKKEQTKLVSFPPMIKKLKMSTISKNDFKKKYNIQYRYIAFPSQNRPNKNWELIFKAIKILKDNGIFIQFITTGSLQDLKTNVDLVELLGIRDFILEIGSISDEDLYLLYKYSDICVASNIIEGMGISGQALEALNVGNIPVIHVKSFGIKESLENVGLTMETADLNWIDIDDDKGLANKIEEVLKDPYPHVEKQKHILEAYTRKTWEDVAIDYMELFGGAIYE